MSSQDAAARAYESTPAAGLYSLPPYTRACLLASVSKPGARTILRVHAEAINSTL
ncbi:hypothetical protein J6590_071320, partial [Homalodisca vitripennis]